MVFIINFWNLNLIIKRKIIKNWFLNSFIKNKHLNMIDKLTLKEINRDQLKEIKFSSDLNMNKQSGKIYFI